MSSLADRVRQGANTVVRKQHPLKRGQIVEQPLRRRVLNLSVIGERTERLLLERRDTAVELISTEDVRAAWPRIDTVRSGEGDVVHRRHAPPHIYERLGRRGVGRRIDEPDVRRQRKGDPDQPVLAEIAEIGGVVAVGPEVVCVDRPKQRVVGIRVALAPDLQALEPGLGVGGRELEMVRRHMTVGAGAPVRAQALQVTVEERLASAFDRAAGLAAAAVSFTVRIRRRCRRGF